ncbi:MAG: hypothetical protein ABIN58_00080 [candidate division WOR-3 bacterium]
MAVRSPTVLYPAIGQDSAERNTVVLEEGEFFASAAQALMAWEHRYNYDRFSMALSGLTPAEKFATFTAASPLLPSDTVSPNPLPALPYGPTTDRRSRASYARRYFSQLRPKPGGHCVTSHYTFGAPLSSFARCHLSPFLGRPSDRGWVRLSAIM